MDDVYGHTIFPEGDVVTLPFSSMSLVDYPMGENLVMDVWSCDGGIQYVATFLKALYHWFLVGAVSLCSVSITPGSIVIMVERSR